MAQQEEQKHKTRRFFIPTLVLLGILGAIFFVKKELPQKVEVPQRALKGEEVFALQRESMSDELEFFGNLEANKEAKLSAKVSGRIASLRVKEGDRVRKGQLLAFLFPDQNAINLRNRSEDFGNFEDFRDNQESFLNRQVRISAENLDVKKAERDYAEKFDPNRLDIAEDEVGKAEAELRTAKRERDAQKDSLKEQSDNLNGSVNLATQDVVDTRILAPFNGIITRKYSEEGEVVNVSVGGLIVSVADVSLYKVVVEVPDILIERLSKGLEARVILDGISGEHKAVVTLVNPKVNATAKKIQVEVTLNAVPQNAKVDMFARVFIKFPPRTTYSVPDNFIFSGFEGPFVVLEDGTQKNVQRGNEKDGKTEITFSGISDGIRIKRNSNGNGR